MKIFASVLCLVIGCATCMKIEQKPPVIVDPPPIDDRKPPMIVDPPPIDDPSYSTPPFPSETTCYFFVPCFTFPAEPICCLPKNGCGGAYTFANSCYLGWYNCEHESNIYYEYRAGECYPKCIVDPPPKPIKHPHKHHEHCKCTSHSNKCGTRPIVHRVEYTTSTTSTSLVIE